MPPPLYHLLVAQRFAERHPELRTAPGFHIGCIAPDAVLTCADCTQPLKDASHLRRRHVSSLESVLAFLRETGPSPFEYGYAIHILTDEWMSGHMKAHFEGSALTRKEQEHLYHTGIAAFCAGLYGDTLWKDIVKPSLLSARNLPCNRLVTAELIRREIEWVLEQEHNAPSACSTIEPSGFSSAFFHQTTDSLLETLQHDLPFQWSGLSPAVGAGGRLRHAIPEPGMRNGLPHRETRSSPSRNR